MKGSSTLLDRPDLSRSNRRAKRQRRRTGLAGALLAFALVAVGGWLVVAGDDQAKRPEPAPRSGPARLLVLAIRADPEPLVAVIGAMGEPPPAAVVVPPSMFVTIPGYGDGTAEDAAELPAPSLRRRSRTPWAPGSTTSRSPI
jgi:hypothetical protein